LNRFDALNVSISILIGKGSSAFLYNQTTFLGVVSLRYWTEFDSKFDGVIKSWFDNSIFFTTITAGRSGVFDKIQLELYNFFDPRSPELIDRYYPPEDDTIYLHIRAAIQMNDKRWLVFLTIDDIGYYCIADALRMAKVS
jgi:hypothetical protein